MKSLPDISGKAGKQRGQFTFQIGGLFDSRVILSIFGFRSLLNLPKKSINKLKRQRSVVLKNRADNVFVIFFQGVYVVVPGDIYAQDSEPRIHKPDHG